MTDLPAVVSPGPLVVSGESDAPPHLAVLRDRCPSCLALAAQAPSAWMLRAGQVVCGYFCRCGHRWAVAWAADVIGGDA